MNKTFREHCREGEKMSSATKHSTNCYHGAATTKGKVSPIAKSLLVLFAMAATFVTKAQTTLYDTPFSTTYNGITLSMPYRIPALVETVNADGEKELIYFGDKRHCGMDIGWGSSASAFGSSYYRIDIVARRSTDGGATWGSEETIQQGTAGCGYGDVAVTSNWENPKEIVFFAATGNVRYGGSSYDSPLETTRFYSKDGGQTWASTNMTSKMYDLVHNVNSSMTALFFSSGRICQSKKIKVGSYYRIYSALCVRISDESNAFVVYSDDFGASWKLLGSGVAVSDGDESKVEELPNGNVLISSRIRDNIYDDNGRRRFNVFKYNSLPTSANTANGSWGSYSSGIQYTGTKKGTNGEILLVPAKDASGNSCHILLHSEPYGTTLAEGRGNVSIFWKKLSSDDITSASEFSGKNWNRYEVSSTTSAYSTMILQHDGTIAFAYEENIWGKGWDAPSDSYSLQGWTELGYDLMYQNFTLAEITNNEYSYYAGEEEEDPVVETVATPAFSLAEGEYEGSATVEITCATDGATIYYTLDGSTPTTASAVYGAAITLTESATISAIAVLNGYNDSEVATASFTIKEEEVVETEEWVTSIISCDKESCSAASYSTLYLDYAVKLPSGVKAYRGVLNKEEATLTLYQIETGIVPALCAVIIENTHVGSSITLAKTTSTTTYTNDLQGTLVAIDDIDPSNYYVLGHTQAYHLGFYHPNSTTLAANKAYIEWSSSNARSLTVKRGDDDDTTEIDVLDSTGDIVIYDLMGRRVSEMLPGRIYIVNGRKIIND